MIIGIDAGHGGHDPGAIGQNGTLEKDIVLDIQKRLVPLLENLNHTVVLSRRGDYSVGLRERVNIFNNAKCDRVISLHINAFSKPEPNYLSAWIVAKGGNAEKMGLSILPCLHGVTGWADGGVRVRGFTIVKDTIAPAVLLELGFISNPKQEAELNQEEVRERLAQAINCGLYLHLNQTN